MCASDLQVRMMKILMACECVGGRRARVSVRRIFCSGAVQGELKYFLTQIFFFEKLLDSEFSLSRDFPNFPNFPQSKQSESP